MCCELYYNVAKIEKIIYKRKKCLVKMMVRFNFVLSFVALLLVSIRRNDYLFGFCPKNKRNEL